jgi:hypothetical protein
LKGNSKSGRLLKRAGGGENRQRRLAELILELAGGKKYSRIACCVKDIRRERGDPLIRVVPRVDTRP